MSDLATQQAAPRLPSLQSGGTVKAIVPQDFDGAWRIATAVVKAGMAPKGLDTPEKAMVAIMHGMEVGLTPMAALQSIAVVNGRPTIWGDGALGLVQGSGLMESHKEWFEGSGDTRKAFCTVKRKGDPEIKTGEFSVADAKKASLWGKAGPWSQYSDRMLKMRARGFALRDGFSDVLRGLGIAEEVQDTPMRDVTPPQPPRPPAPPAPPSETIADEDGVVIDHEDPSLEDAMSTTGEEVIDDTEFFQRLEEDLAVVSDMASLEEVWNDADPMARFDGKPQGEINQGIALAIRKRAEKRVGAAA
jgi:hypothetical protein